MVGSFQHGAKATLQGVVSNNATWQESVLMVDGDGEPLTGVEDQTWTLTLRKNEADTTALVTITPTVEEGDDSTVMTIDEPPSTISGLVGDYVADLSSEDSEGVITHWAHGRITFLNQPVRS